MLINVVTLQGPFLQRKVEAQHCHLKGACVEDRTLEKTSKDGANYYYTEIMPQCSDKSFQEWPEEKEKYT